MSSANQFGHLFKIITFGESHGAAMGVVIEGCPAGITVEHSLLNALLARRRPGLSAATSMRAETDEFEIVSGVYESTTLGTPITVLVRNRDARSADYDKILTEPRRGHADDVWRDKFSAVDHRGGGRSSGRETVTRVIGGAFALMFLKSTGVLIHALPASIGPIKFTDADHDFSAPFYLRSEIWSEVEKMLLGLKAEGDSAGGVVDVRIVNVPRGLGQPVFHKLKSELAAAFMSVGAVCGVELGGGFALASQSGLEVHRESTESVYGGIRGGISTGEVISMRVAFKPTSSILDVAKRGRHDPCILLRALPVLESMASLVIADHVLWARLDN